MRVQFVFWGGEEQNAERENNTRNELTRRKINARERLNGFRNAQCVHTEVEEQGGRRPLVFSGGEDSKYRTNGVGD